MTATVVVSSLCVVSAVMSLTRGLARATAWLILAAGVLALVRLAPSPESSSSWLFLVSLVATPLWPACAAVAGSSWPGRPTSRLHAAVGVAALLAASLVSGVLPALFFDPRDAACFQCPRNLVEVVSAPDLHEAAQRVADVVTVAWGTAIAALCVDRWRRSTTLHRGSSTPVVLGAGAIAGLAAARSGHALGLPADVYDTWTEGIASVQLALLALTAVGVWLRISLPRRTFARVARTVLDATPTAAALESSLARAVGDPGLTVTYRRPDGSPIDAGGRPAPTPAGRPRLPLSRAGSTYAEVFYDPRLTDGAELVQIAASASALALEYIAAQARLLAETSDALTARRRVVARADTERVRLERDLHDGAQQALISLSVQIAAEDATAPTRVGETAAAGRDALRGAQQQIDLALQDLRTVARGLFPVSLAEGGVAAALRELGDHTAVPLLVDGAFAGACDLDAAMAVYELAAGYADAVPATPGTVVRVRLRGGGPAPLAVRVTVTTPDPVARWPAPRAHDRVAALGGTVSVTSSTTTFAVEGVIPCGS